MRFSFLTWKGYSEENRFECWLVFKKVSFRKEDKGSCRFGNLFPQNHSELYLCGGVEVASSHGLQDLSSSSVIIPEPMAVKACVLTTWPSLPSILCRKYSLVAQLVKNLPAVQETWFSLWVRKIPCKSMATHSSILAWRIPWTEELDGLRSIGSQRVGHD